MAHQYPFCEVNLDELRRGLHISRLENDLFSGKVAWLNSIRLGGKKGKGIY